MSGGHASRRRRWIRVRPKGRESLGASLVAGVAAAGVGVATFYLTRLLLAREPLEGPPGPRGNEGGEPGGRAAGA